MHEYHVYGFIQSFDKSKKSVAPQSIQFNFVEFVSFVNLDIFLRNNSAK